MTERLSLLGRRGGIILTCNIFVTEEEEEEEEEESKRRRRRKELFPKTVSPPASQSVGHLPGPHLWPLARSLFSLQPGKVAASLERNSKGNCFRGLVVSRQFSLVKSASPNSISLTPSRS